MPPKKKDKKGKKLEKVKLGQEEDIVMEISKQFYENEMADINRKIDRQGGYHIEMQEGKIEIEEKIKEIEKEKGEIIKGLEETLQQKIETYDEKKAKVEWLIEEIKIRKQQYIEQIERMEAEFNAWVEEMTQKIQELEEWLETLEYFRDHKEEFYEQYQRELEAYDEREKEHQRNLYAIEQKFELSKKKLRKEADQRLLQISMEFQQRSEKEINPTIHRLIQENIAIQNELKDMNTMFENTQKHFIKLRNNAKKFRTMIPSQEEEKEKLLAQSMVQAQVTKNLLVEEKKLLDQVRELAYVEIENKELRERVEDLEFLLTKAKEESEDLKITLAEKDYEMCHMKNNVLTLKKTSRRLDVILHNSTKVVIEAMSVPLVPLGDFDEEEDLREEIQIERFRKRRNEAFKKKGKILRRLMSILTQAQPSRQETEVLRSSTDPIQIDTIDFIKVFKQPSEITITIPSIEEPGEEEEGVVEELPLKRGSLRTVQSLSNDSLERPPSSETLIIPIAKSSSSEEYYGEFGEEEVEQPIDFAEKQLLAVPKWIREEYGEYDDMQFEHVEVGEEEKEEEGEEPTKEEVEGEEEKTETAEEDEEEN